MGLVTPQTKSIMSKDESYDWTEVLKVMTEAMESHPFWKRLEGTPLENDLPVRAAKAFFNIVVEY